MGLHGGIHPDDVSGRGIRMSSTKNRKCHNRSTTDWTVIFKISLKIPLPLCLVYLSQPVLINIVLRVSKLADA